MLVVTYQRLGDSVPVVGPSEALDPKQETFDAFYRSQYARLVGALALVAGDIGTAEELAQETFLRAYARWSRVSALDRPAGWIYTTAFNLLRRRWQRKRRPPEQVVDRPLALADETEARIDLERALRRLPHQQRSAVVLRHVLGFSTEEAAQALGMTSDALRASLHRALVALRLTTALAQRED